jgi:hypothetical protein
MMARHGMSTLLVRMPYPRLACGIRPRQSALQGTGQVAGCVPLGYACSRGPSAGDVRAHVYACVFQQSLGIMIRLCICMRGHK